MANQYSAIREKPEDAERHFSRGSGWPEHSRRLSDNPYPEIPAIWDNEPLRFSASA
jgi:hypothetical protein